MTDQVEGPAVELHGWPKLRQLYKELPTHPHILDLARRVHPIWVFAHGHKDDRGVELLAREIAHCIIAIQWGRERGEDMSRRYVIGPGIIVTGSGLAPENYQIAVLAGEAFAIRIEMGVV